MPTVEYNCPTGLPDDDRSLPYLIVDWILTGVIVVVVSLRTYSRGWLTRSLGSDDITILCVTPLIISGSVSDTVASYHGFGRHCAYSTKEEFFGVQKWIATSWLIGFGSFFLVRCSVMLFTLRLLPRTKKKSQAVVYSAFALNFAITAIAMISFGLQCMPFTGIWRPQEPAKCAPASLTTTTNLVNGVLACVVDIMTASVPAFLLHGVKMKKKTKTSLNIIFGLGLVTAGLSIGRVATLTRETTAEDQTYRIIMPIWFAMVESKLGVILASAPALRQAWSYYNRTSTLKPCNSRQEPNSDFTSMRHRVNYRDWFWRGKRDPERAQGLITTERSQRPGDTKGSHSHTTFDGSGGSYQAKATSGSYGGYDFKRKNFGATDPENSPLSEFEQRVVNSVPGPGGNEPN